MTKAQVPHKYCDGRSLLVEPRPSLAVPTGLELDVALVQPDHNGCIPVVITNTTAYTTYLQRCTMLGRLTEGQLVESTPEEGGEFDNTTTVKYPCYFH